MAVGRCAGCPLGVFPGSAVPPPVGFPVGSPVGSPVGRCDGPLGAEEEAEEEADEEGEDGRDEGEAEEEDDGAFREGDTALDGTSAGECPVGTLDVDGRFRDASPGTPARGPSEWRDAPDVPEADAEPEEAEEEPDVSDMDGVDAVAGCWASAEPPSV
ncbi:hypothetical protein, partial [Streptomyces sp. WAC05858]|uniref:hypothetical protein n=1 Tax=Streptomyces sp. WAC05858 TaxID=2487409 RepID=UPI000FA4C0F7